MKKLTVEQKIVAGFVVALVILAVVGLAGYRSIEGLDKDAQWFEHTGEVLFHLESVVSSVHCAETGQRSLALAGPDRYLEPYYEGVKNVNETFLRLRDLTAGDASEKKQLDALEPIIAEEVAFAKKAFERRKEGLEAEDQTTLAERGKALLDKVRDSISEMENKERELLKQRQERARRSSQLAKGVIIAGSLLAFAFVSVALWMIRRDIARRRRIEVRLAETNTKLAAVLNASTPVALIATDMHGSITFFNAGAERMLGCPGSEVVGKMLAMDFFLDSEVVAEAKRMYAKSGRLLNGLDVLVETARRGEVVEREWTFVRKDGSQLTGSSAVTAMRDEAGRITGFMFVAKDITEIKRSEQLLRATNNELKAFAYTVSHDLKTPLRGISGYALELKRHHGEGLSERAHFCTSQILTAAGNLDRLIEDLLLYSRLDTESPKLTDVNVAKLIDGILKDRSQEVLDRGVEIDVSIPFSTIHTWERGLLQVLTNLLDNALKYTRHSNPPRIRLRGEQKDETYRISISDNGVGFDMRYHDRIFGLFNRLVRAEDFEGTGAGLAIAKKLLDKLHGKIWAESEPCSGSTFFIELPRETETEMET